MSLPRLRAMFVNWLDWTESAELPGGCPMIGRWRLARASLC